VTRCIFHADLDAFFVSVEQLHDPSLKGKPVIVGGDPGTRGVVAASSYEARSYGVHSAMPLVQARRLCPHAIFVPVHFERYVEASQQFMGLLEAMAPTVEPLGLDEAFLDVSELASDFDAAASHAAKLKHLVHTELGLTASVGIATCKVVAKVASDYDKPDGLVLVRPGEEAAFLSELAVGKLPGVGKKTGETLRALAGETRTAPPPLRSGNRQQQGGAARRVQDDEQGDHLPDRHARYLLPAGNAALHVRASVSRPPLAQEAGRNRDAQAPLRGFPDCHQAVDPEREFQRRQRAVRCGYTAPGAIAGR